MNLRYFLLSSLLISPLAFAHPHPGDQGGARNKDGSIVTGVLTAQFAPADGLTPVPSNLFYLGTTDLSLNPPIDDPTSPAAGPLLALSALDGFSTTEKWVVNFVDDNGAPGSIDPASVVPGQSVRVFQVTADPTTGYNAVTGLVRELTPGVDFFATAAPGGVLAILPLKPLPEYSTFMAVLTDDIRDAAGNDATPDQTYFLSKAQSPWVDASGNSTYPLLDNATAQGVEQLRQITQTMEAVAFAAGMDPEHIILAFTVQTQSITPTLRILRSIATPAPVAAGPTGLTTAAAGGFGLADIVVGIITLPYYSGIPSASNPIAPLSDFWNAAPGAYIPPFDQFGLDPTSTNLTIANPVPVQTGSVTVPFIMGVPNAASGFTKPEEGWPVVIYQHGITRNRTDVLALADAIAATGSAVIAIDQPLHGVVPAVEPDRAPFYIENHPVFGDLAQERTFDADYFDNTTGAPGPDGITDASGTSTFNLGNLRAVRDNLRQASADLSVLAVSLQNISVNGDAIPDLNPFNVGLLSHSLGVTVSLPFLAVEPIVSRAYINAAPGMGIPTIMGGVFGARIDAGLAAAGILPGTPDYVQFLLLAQTVIDSGDGYNWAAEAALKTPVVHNMVVGDDTVPNTVPGQPQGGSEGLNRVMGLTSYSQSQIDPDGLRHVARFVTGEHGSLIRPTFPAVTAEMQGQFASFLASGGTFVNVGDETLLVPVVQVSGSQRVEQPSVSGKGKKRKNLGPKNGQRSRLAKTPLEELLGDKR